MDLDNFFFSVYLDKHPEETSDLIMDVLDDAIDDEEFGLIDKILKKIEIDKISLASTICFLSMTLAIKEKLPSRKDFLNKAKKEFVKRYFGGLE